MNLLKLFFQKPKDYFQRMPLTHTQWSVVTWNWDLKDSDERKVTLEIHHSDNVFRAMWNQENLSFVEDGRQKVFSHKNNQEDKNLFNLSTHVHVKTTLESHFDWMRRTHEADINQETRSLQWVQATFKTLDGALDKVKNNPELIFTCALFSGVNPQINQKLLRIICFNLDINLFMLEDDTLRLVIYDDKNLGHGAQDTASFNQIIRLTKPLFYDEIIKLVNKITSVGEIR